MWREGKPCARLVGMQTGAATMETSGGSSEAKARPAPQPPGLSTPRKEPERKQMPPWLG